MENGKKPLIVSGMQPTGSLHIGNWAGSLKNWLSLQDAHPGQCVFFIADYHAMTIDDDPALRPGRILDLAATFLAMGIDPKRSLLFVQSDVPECAELTWILNTVTPVSEMLKMTQYKDKAVRNEKNVNMGLLDYPVLQAADILLYGGTAVPVGEDQVQHVETTRTVAKAFNRRFGETFAEPQALLTETSRVKSLTEPTAKMSKSHGPKSYLALDDTPEEIAAKLAHVPTEPTGQVTEEKLATEAYAGVALLFDLLAMFGSTDEKKAALAGKTVRYGDLKRRAAEAVADGLVDYREKKTALMKDPKKVRKILDAGAKKARKIAVATMEDVCKKTGLR